MAVQESESPSLYDLSHDATEVIYNTSEVYQNFEREYVPEAFDCFVVLGRGIEQIDRPSGTEWRPTRSIETLPEIGTHTGIRDKKLSADAANAVVGGANANVIASVELFQELQRIGVPPKTIIFAAGRPPYLQNQPDKTLSEGKILAEKFKAKTSSGVETVVLDRNQNTSDDITESLEIASARGYKKLVFITIALHQDRAHEFLSQAISTSPIDDTIETKFIPAEELLLRRYSRSPAAFRMFATGYLALAGSSAWQLTEFREKRGLKALQEGNY